jgi:hypothetical protein
MKSNTFVISTVIAASLLGCVEQDADPVQPDDNEFLNEDALSESESEVGSASAWFHLDTANGLGAATLTVMNGARAKCPTGRRERTCFATKLVLPADCNFECQDGLLSMRGETLLRGKFSGSKFLIEQGFDTFSRGKGRYSAYRITAAATCSSDPCPGALSVQKLNSTAAAVDVTSVDFSRAVDPNFKTDSTHGDAQALSKAGLLASGRVVAGVFVADRVWRLETPRPMCEPQQVARANAYRGDATDFRQFRTVAQAERAVNPDPDGGGVAWLVRTGETAIAASFTSGRNDLWAVKYDVNKATCEVTVTAEH